MSELRSWSAGDPEPPLDVMVVQHPNSQQYRRVNMTVMYDGVPSGRWRGWQVGPLGWPLHWSQVTDRLGGYTLTEVLPETPTPDERDWDSSAKAHNPMTCPPEVAEAYGPVLGSCPNHGFPIRDEAVGCPHPSHQAALPVSVVQDDTPARCECCATNDNPGFERGSCVDCGDSFKSHDSCRASLDRLLNGPIPAPVECFATASQDDGRSDACVHHDVYVERLRVAVGGSLSQGPEDYISEAERICALYREGTQG